MLITLAWAAAHDAIRTHRTEELARVRMEALGTALAIEEQLRRELLTLNQTLNILEYIWERDPTHFDLATWSSHVGVLSDVSLQLFIADARGIVRSSTRSAIIGTDVSGRDYFRHEKALPADDDKMFVGSLTQGQVTHLWQINLVRQLNNPDGSFAGVIAASYDANSFWRLYAEVDLGADALIAVVSMRDGNAWTLSNPTRASAVVNIANASILAPMQASIEGSWEGSSGLDDADRIYSFATVPDRGLKVVVGVDRAQAMGASVAWEQNALVYAGGTTFLVLLMATLLLREENAARRRHESIAHERAILETTLTGMSDGIMMVDGDCGSWRGTSTFRSSPACRPIYFALAFRWKKYCAVRWRVANLVWSTLRLRSRDAWHCCAPAPRWERSSEHVRAGGGLRYAAIRCQVLASSRGIPTSRRVIRPTSGCAKHRPWRRSEG